MPNLEEIAKHPFGQSEYYFSESQRQLIRLDEMVPQYALHAFNKLLREYGDGFRYSPLYDTFLDKLSPSAASLRDVLRQHGTALVLTDDLVSVNAARKRLRRAGASETHRESEFVVGIMDADLTVNVRKERA